MRAHAMPSCMSRCLKCRRKTAHSGIAFVAGLAGHQRLCTAQWKAQQLHGRTGKEMMPSVSPAHADQKSNMQYTIPLVVDHGGDQKASSKETGGKLKQLINEFMEKVKSKKNKTEGRFKGLAGEEATKSVSRAREYNVASAALLEQHVQCRGGCRTIVHIYFLNGWDVFMTVWGSDGACAEREQGSAACLPFQRLQLPAALNASPGDTLKKC